MFRRKTKPPSTTKQATDTTDTTKQSNSPLIQRKKKHTIAIIGGGITGLVLGYLLKDKFLITLYEKNSYLGGNSKTVDIEILQQKFTIDSGFSGFNRRHYPNFVKLLEHLQVPIQTSTPSLGATFNSDKSMRDWQKHMIEYSTYNTDTLFAYRYQWVNWDYIKMYKDIKRFHKIAYAYINNYQLSLREWLLQCKFRDYFTTYYLSALLSNVWGFTTDIHLLFNQPIGAILTILDRLQLLDTSKQGEYCTVIGGSRNYIQPLIKDWKHRIILNSTIKNIERLRGRVFIEDDRKSIFFDKVIFACHPYDIMQMVDELEQKEQRVLAAFKKKTTRTIIHSSDNYMPLHKKCWASFIYKANMYNQSTNAKPQIQGFTHWLNSIQPLHSKYPIFVTRDYQQKPDFIYNSHTFEHALVDNESFAHQNELNTLQDYNHSFYSGGYNGYDTHEDAIKSAIKVAGKLGVIPPF